MRLPLCLAVLVAAAPASAQTDARTRVPRFSTEVRVVNLSASAMDAASHQYVTTLERGDFIVLENGRPQDIVYFSRDDLPVLVMLLMDVSTSVESRLPSIMKAARMLVDGLRPQDMAAVVMFHSEMFVVQDFTDDRDALNRAVGEVPDGDHTALYRSVYVALRDMNQVAFPDGRRCRKALVLLTDGIDTASGSFTDDITLNEARTGEVTVFTVLMPPMVLPEAERPQTVEELRAQSFLIRLAEDTGGRSFRPLRIGQLDEVYRNIAHEVAVQYTIGYTPDAPGDGKFRTISVQTPGRPSTLVRHRRGYLAVRTR
ncbi:MAG TPA: VWA domain-containing protein [Candidatus Paceibacterota bacterium]|nr:VWA domain-containing protein [Candidatus Paceibacterota bacterium]